MLMKSPWDRASLGLFALVALLIAFTFRDYGLSWDEPFHIEYGARLLRYYATFGQDTSAFNYINLYLYGGLFDVPVALLVQWLPFDLADTRHLLIALTGLLGIVGTWRLARLLGGPRAGFFAALLLALAPSWYGHMFINPKDIPFGVTMIWATYFLARLLREMPRPSWKSAVAFGLLAGMSMGMRIGGVLIFVYLATVVGVWFLASMFWRKTPGPVFLEAVAALPRFLLSAAVAYLLMVIVWPWALTAPLQHPYEALTTFSHFPFNTPVLVEGVWIGSNKLPIDYLPLMIAVKLPILHLIAVGGLLVFTSRGIRSAKRQVLQGHSAWLAWVTVVVALILPIVYVLVTRPVLYNEMRHFLFILPPAAVLAGLSLDRFWNWSASTAIPARLALGGILALYLSTHVFEMVRLHPYEYVDYNRIVGGVRGAAHLFELDYWSTSLRETYAAMKQHVRQTEGEAALHRPWRIRFCGAPEASLYYIEKEWRPIWIGDKSEADFEVGSSGHSCPPPEGPLMVEVRRDGALLGYARDLRHP